jgi:hypothetical protein
MIRTSFFPFVVQLIKNIFLCVFHIDMGEQNNFVEEENDQIIKVLGHFGKWQLLIIVPTAFLRIVIAWEIFVSCIS